jgi:hypothetical protein
MASKYQTKYAVPKEFPSIAKDFLREILRAQPDDIFKFGAEYFRGKVRVKEAAGLRGMSVEALEKHLAELFMAGDVDGNGTLSKKEFRNVTPPPRRLTGAAAASG